MAVVEEGACGCPFCDGGEVPAEIVERIMQSAASQCEAMTLEEFRTWLHGVDREGPEPANVRP